MGVSQSGGLSCKGWEWGLGWGQLGSHQASIVSPRKGIGPAPSTSAVYPAICVRGYTPRSHMPSGAVASPVRVYAFKDRKH